MAIRLDASTPDFERAFETLLTGKRESSVDVNDAVAKIIADVRTRGDAALIELTNKFDRLSLTPETLRISDADLDAAVKACDATTLDALKLAKTRIEAYHARQKPTDARYTDEQGVELGHRWTPVGAVGLYVPGGTANYPSSVLMNAVPAKVAGVRRVVMVVKHADQ